jgi:hypothetical protein
MLSCCLALLDCVLGGVLQDGLATDVNFASIKGVVSS